MTFYIGHPQISPQIVTLFSIFVIPLLVLDILEYASFSLIFCLHISSRDKTLLANIKPGCLNNSILRPEFWQSPSTEKDVLERDIDTKENITKPNPKDIINDELGLFPPLLPIDL